MSQIQTIRTALENGEKLTPLIALQKYGCFRLAAVVHRLIKRDGMDIKAELIHISKAEGLVARYSMEMNNG